MTAAKAFSDVAVAALLRVVVVPFFIVIFNVLELTGRPFRPVWDG